MENKLIGWILRIAVAGEFLGHGVFAIQGKETWVNWIVDLLNIESGLAGQILLIIGLIDLLVAFIVLARPIKIVLLWATLWGFWTAILRPIVGEPIWDFVERSANWGAPLALLLIKGWPKRVSGWFN